MRNLVKHGCWRCCIGLLACWFATTGRAQFVISEFMASNSSTLVDEDGDSSDWIEIQNPTPASASLEGYYLTDDPALLTKWRFPLVSVAAQDFLVVFASGKDRTSDVTQLHANFSLDAAGEYLALVRPDGSTVVSEFSPQFPPQERDYSYGRAQVIVTNTLVSAGATARYRVPTDSSLGTAWTAPDFADSTWANGPTGLGYETSVPGFAVRNVKANTTVGDLGMAEQVLADASLQQGVATANAPVVNFFGSAQDGHYGNNLNFPGHVTGADYDDFVVEATGTVSIPSAGNWTFGVNSDDGFSLLITNRTSRTGFYIEFAQPRSPSDTLGVFNVPAGGEYDVRLLFYERGGGSCVELYAAAGSFTAWSGADFDLVGDTINGGLAIRSAPIGGSGLGYRSLIATDVESVLKNRNSSLYCRIPVPAPATMPESLFLKVRYDDGFIATLNGQEIARRNAPAAAEWNSTATAENPTSQALAFEVINVSDFIPWLSAGGNVLTFHALNLRADDPDFLLGPELVEYQASGSGTHYFATPTPGTVNSPGFVAFVADTQFTVDRGFFTKPFEVEITTATPLARIYFTTDGTEPSPTNGQLYAGPITVSGTLTLRAAAYRDGYEPSNVDTQTYLFVEDVIRQSPGGSPPAGWPSSWGGNTVDYGMDPNVVDNSLWSGQIREALTSLPSFSVVMDLDDLFDPSTGIYANPGQDGRAWERPCSVELVYPDGTEGFQINAGIRIRGGFSRSTGNPKHAFRLFFRSEYGAPKLRYPLFGDEGTDTFDAIDLRTFQNYSWSFQGDSRGIFVRDQINRDLQLAMGHQGERGEFYHLYINGQYWGLYNTCERPEASYGATYYGGNSEDYDVVKVEAGPYTVNATDGTMAAWTRLYNLAKAGLASDSAYEFVQGNNPDGTRNPSYENLVEIDNLIDYMLIILYGGNLDAPISNFLGNDRPNNWYGVRNQTDQFGGFRFFVHDAEHTFLDVNQDRTGPWPAGDSSVVYSSPQWIWQKLQGNTEFRLRVADHVHRYFFNGGLLTTQSVRTRFLERTAEIDPAVVAESARWGDAKREPALNRNDWLGSVNSVANNYIAQRSSVVLNQLRSDGLYPSVAAPTFSQHGGNISAGYNLTMSAPVGVVYYTLDGSDPRLRGGAVSGAARRYAEAVPLSRSTTVKARTLSNGTWSALNDAAFTIIYTWTDLFITELMYHPGGDSTGLDVDEFEFIELKNVGSSTLDLSGVHFAEGIQYTFPIGTELAPGTFAVLVSNPTAFTNRYPGVAYDGVYTGRLSNGGENVALVHAAGAPVFSVAYDDAAPWPLAADGTGFSLVPINPNVNVNPNDPASWRASHAELGSPGFDDPAVNISPVWITEALTHTDLPQLDTIELYNPNPVAVDIGSWYLTDDRNVPAKFQIPSGTVIPSGGFLTFDEGDFNPFPGVGSSFNLSSHGEEVWLYSANSGGELTGYSDGFRFGAAANGVSFGRYTLSTGGTRYPAQTRLTLGAPNAGPRVGPVVINEIQYHPALGDTEFIELKNLTAAAVMLYDPDFPTNHWRLEGVDFDFPAAAQIPANGLALVVEGDPSAFRSKHNVPVSVPVFGPFSGLLQNNGERLELQRPDHPDVDTNGVVVVPMIAVDVVRYDDLPPWPVGASGTGASLERMQASAFGDDPVNWRVSPGAASPGLENTGNRRPEVFAGADQQIIAATFPVDVVLEASVSDDGEPVPPGRVTIAWTQIAGPGTVFFANDSASSTSAVILGVGTYALRLTASDGVLQTTDDVVITVTRESGPLTVIARGSNWNYWDQGSLPALNWNTAAYSDVGWLSGPAQLGYGDGDEVTTLSYGPDGGNKFITTWFRRQFSFSAVNRVQELDLGVLRDDGVVVYLNGTEVFRSNMPVEDVNETTFATTAIGGAEESTFFSAQVDPALLVEGSNLLAVEVHQANRTSSDISFDLELSALAFPDNTAPVVDAGSDIQTDPAVPVSLQGHVADDGLPIPPGQVTFGWSQVSGPGVAVFSDTDRLDPSVRFPVAGTYVLQLTASDGVLAHSDRITAMVSGDAFGEWMARYFTAAELADPLITGPDADPDLDGHTNAQEFETGTIPNDGSSVLQIDMLILTEPPSDEVRLLFKAVAGRGYTVEGQDGLAGSAWFKLTDIEAAAADRLIDLQVPAAAGPLPRFYRVVTPIRP